MIEIMTGFTKKKTHMMLSAASAGHFFTNLYSRCTSEQFFCFFFVWGCVCVCLFASVWQIFFYSQDSISGSNKKKIAKITWP